MAKLEIYSRDVRAFQQNFVETFSSLCISGIFMLKVLQLDRLMEKVLSFRCIFALDVSLHR